MNKNIARDIREGRLYPPTAGQLEDAMFDGTCEAACEHQCVVEPDGYCEHGRPSWLLAYGLI